MAMSLLRLGRLGSVKCLLREGWSPPKTQFAAALCTKADVPPKTPKKGKASSKTIEADERASLLAYKPAVAFPSKLVATGFLSKDVALGESAASEMTTDSPLAVEEPKSTKVAPSNEATKESEGIKTMGPDSEAQKDNDNNLSSSTSDSDSDSDSDDEEPKTEPPEQTGKKAEEKKSSGLATEQVYLADKKAKPESALFEEECAETVTKATPEVPAPSAKPVGSVETLVDPAPIVSSSATQAIPEAPGESLKVVTPDKIVDITAKEVKTAPMEEPKIKAEEALRVIPEASLGVACEAPGDVAAKSEDLFAKAEAGALSAPSEELVDPAPVAADAVEALAQTDVVETPEEQAPEKAPEPEPFDNTTYKNLQHHNYNMYTFTDMDVEMAKYRLPQPSSGRPSQH